MKVAVCIKQVPNTMELSIDHEKGTLIREGVPYIMNPFDLIAIEAALQIKDLKKDTEISSLSMGPISAVEILKQSFAMGVNRGALLNDSKFSGADVLATSYTLAKGIKLLKDIDIIICGKQTIDGDTSQVGQAIGEHLGISHIYNVQKIESITNDSVIVTQELENEHLLIEIKIPCVLIMSKDCYTPRVPSLKAKLEAKKKEIIFYSSKDFKESELEFVGFAGSSTRVKKCFVLSQNEKIDKIIYNESEAKLSELLYQNILKKIKKRE
ncbi:MAG: electron transfer flavoprotein subunit beta/FixA family protein [Cetobacterium sp.]